MLKFMGFRSCLLLFCFFSSLVFSRIAISRAMMIIWYCLRKRLLEMLKLLCGYGWSESVMFQVEACNYIVAEPLSGSELHHYETDKSAAKESEMESSLISPSSVDACGFQMRILDSCMIPLQPKIKKREKVLAINLSLVSFTYSMEPFWHA